MRHLVLVFLLFSLLPASNQQYYKTFSFQFEDGSTCDTLLIGFRTFGEVDPSGGNIVLMPTYFGGTSKGMAGLLGPDKLIDTTAYFVILVDALGNGVSGSPGNNNQIKQVTIGDMVESQYLLLREHFKVHKIFAVVGGSMAGMQAFEWLERYPEFFSKAAIYVSTPAATMYDLHYWSIHKRLIDSGRAAAVSDSVIRGTLNLLQSMQATSPERINFVNTNTDFGAYYKKLVDVKSGIFGLEDWRAQVVAMMEHQAKPPASFVGENILIIVSKNDRIVTPQPSIEYAQKKGCRLIVLDNDCGHYAVGCELQRCATAIKNFLKGGN